MFGVSQRGPLRGAEAASRTPPAPRRGTRERGLIAAAGHPPRLAAMGEDGVQAEKSSAYASPSAEGALEHRGSPSPVPSGSRSPSLQPPAPGEAIRDGSQVNAITVLTLLDKLVNMLDSVQEKQQKMEHRQIELEGSVKGIQSDLSKLCKHHTSTSNTVAKLLEKSRKVSAHTREVRDRMDRQCAQVKRLEHNHAQLLRRNHFKVLIFQVSGGQGRRGAAGTGPPLQRPRPNQGMRRTLIPFSSFPAQDCRSYWSCTLTGC